MPPEQTTPAPTEPTVTPASAPVATPTPTPIPIPIPNPVPNQNQNVITASGYESNTGLPQTPIDPVAIENLIKPKIEELHKKIDDYKKELITVLGIFASFITFVSVEFKLFEKVVTMGDFIALSILLVSLMMLFVITLQSVIKDDNLFYKKPLFKLVVILFVIATLFYCVPRMIESYEQRNFVLPVPNLSIKQG